MASNRWPRRGPEGRVTKPLPMYPRTKIITSEEEGQEVASLLGNGEACLLLGHGAVTASTAGVEGAVLTMVHLEHRLAANTWPCALPARTICSSGYTWLRRQPWPGPKRSPRIKARLVDVPGGRPRGGIRAYFREVVTADM